MFTPLSFNFRIVSWQSFGSSYLCGLWFSARVIAPFTWPFEQSNLESEREVGEGTAPGAWVSPLYHCSVDFTDLHLVRFHYQGRKQKMKVCWKQTSEGGKYEEIKENKGAVCWEINTSECHRCLTYIWQEKLFGVVLHQEVLCLHIDSDEDRLAFFSVGAVLLVRAQDPVTAVVHSTEKIALTWGACPIPTAGVYRTLSVNVVRKPAKKSKKIYKCFIHTDRDLNAKKQPLMEK